MRRLKSKKSEREMRVVTIDSRELQTITSLNSAWSNSSDPIVCTKTNREVSEGALVRVVPPHDASSALIEQLRRRVLSAGAVAARAVGKASAPAVVPTETRVSVVNGVTVPRQIVQELVAQSLFSNKDELLVTIEQFLSSAEKGKVVRTTNTQQDVGHIVGVRLQNWECFQGEFELALEAKMYSITAQSDDDVDRSNWFGKSAFLRAIVFALTGHYSTKTADGWITEAEPMGGVDVQFSSGLFVSRWKERGKGTRVEVSLSEDDEDPYTGEAAQRFLEETVVDYDTLVHTSYFAQGKTDQFVTMGPTCLSEIVNTWLGIEWISDAADACRVKLNKSLTLEKSLRLQLEQIVTDHGSDLSQQVELQQAVVQREHASVLTLKDRKDEARTQREVVAEWRRAKRNAAIYDQLRAELDELDEQTPESVNTSPFEENERKAVRLEAVARKAHTLALKVKRGKFDGECPVAGIQCPITKKINASVIAAAQKVRETKEELDIAIHRCSIAKEQSNNARLVQRKKDRLDERRATLKRELERLESDWQFIQMNSECPVSESLELDDQYEEACQRHVEAVSVAKGLEAVRDKCTALEARLDGLKSTIELLSSAYVILGKNGVQKIIAKGMLDQVERDGNRATQAAGIDLAFRVTWATETKKPAESCEVCGMPFPSSARIKECSHCGAKRGKKMSYELRLVMSNRSGGADDLGGIMFQLAASNWLRMYQQSQWAIFMIDEPFGELDRANVRGLSRRLSSLLGDQFGAVQSFIVAHHQDILESCPGRIHITNACGRSSIEVVV